MENYSNKQGQAGQFGQTSTMDKSRGFDSSKSDSNQNEGKEGIGGDVQNKVKEGQEKAGQFMCALNKQVKDNPWPVVAGVALGAFILGSLINRSNK